MKEIKVEGKTVKEAIEKGLKELGLTREQVEVEIVQVEKKGILGIPVQNACIIMREKNFNKIDKDMKTYAKEYEVNLSQTSSFTPTGNILNDVKKLLTELLGISKIDVKILKELYDENKNYVYINIQSKDAGLLLYDGAKGLLSLQQLISIIINKNYDKKITLKIDTEEFWSKTEFKLKKDVEHAIDFINRTKKSYKMKPMPSPFRKIVHDIVKENYPDYSTRSIGSGKFRRVVIMFNRNKKNRPINSQSSNSTTIQNNTQINNNRSCEEREKQENV